MESDRALAQAHDHHVPARLDPLGNGDFALAAQQLDRAHFAQIHAHRIVSAFAGGSLLDCGLCRGLGVLLGAGRQFFDFVGFLGSGLGFLVAFDDLHAHVGQRGLDILDLVRTHLALGQRIVELVVSDVTLALCLGDKLLDRCLVEIDQGSVAVVLGLRLGGHEVIQSSLVLPLGRAPVGIMIPIRRPLQPSCDQNASTAR